MRSVSSLPITRPRISPRSNGSCATTAISFLAFAPSVLLSVIFWVHPPPRPLPTVTVLCYHNYDAQKITPFTLDSARFRDQMRFIKAQHIPVIPLARLVEHMQTGAPLPSRSVIITID